jgi:hypothetical protein
MLCHITTSIALAVLYVYGITCVVVCKVYKYLNTTSRLSHVGPNTVLLYSVDVFVSGGSEGPGNSHARGTCYKMLEYTNNSIVHTVHSISQ